MRDVAIIGIGMTDFGERWTESEQVVPPTCCSGVSQERR